VPQDFFDKVGPLVPEAAATFGRIGGGDPSAREDEQREIKAHKMRKWLTRHPAPETARINPKLWEFQVPIPLGRTPDVDEF
jgi:hypothetical protein